MMSLSRILNRIRARFMTEMRYRGLRVPIDGPQVIRPIKDELFANRYEAPEIDALEHVLQPGDRMLEVGVGIGVVSALAAFRVPDARIEAYEANPDLMAPIRRLHEMNGITSIRLENAILEQAPDAPSRPFHIHWSFAESSLIPTAGSVRSVEVPTEDFTSKLNGFQPDVLVVDIEGGEADLLTGADLSKIRALVLELHPAVLSDDQINAIRATCDQAGLTRRRDLEAGQVTVYERTA